MENLSSILATGIGNSPAIRYPVEWSKDYVAQLRRITEHETIAHSSIDADLLPALVACVDGDFDHADQILLAVLACNLQAVQQDQESFFSLLFAAFVAQRADVLAAMLLDKYQFPSRLEFGFEETGAGAAIVRWEVSQSRAEHRFIFNAATLRQDDTREQVLRFTWEFPLLTHYANQPETEFGMVVLNQGDVGSRPGLAYCDNRPEYFLIPDYAFVQTRGYQNARQVLHERQVPWDRKCPIAFWPGATADSSPEGLDCYSLNQIKLSEFAAEIKASNLFDSGFGSLFQTFRPEAPKSRSGWGPDAERVPWQHWGDHKYLIDIDQRSIPRSDLIQKLLTGSPVLKVKPYGGLAQWFHGDLIEWVNYVPIASDLSDLVEKVKWLARNDSFAYEVGRRGMELAQRLTYETELDRSVPVISSAFRYSRGNTGDVWPIRRQLSPTHPPTMETHPVEPEWINIARGGGMGDILLCTPTLRALKSAYPEKKLAFFGNYLDLLRGLPYVDATRDFADQPEDTTQLIYEGRIDGSQHIARMFGALAGIEVNSVRPDCVLDQNLVRQFTERFAALPRPWVVINRRASLWTPNKDWPNPLWCELISRLRTSCTVIEIGRPASEAVFDDVEPHVNLIGRTTLLELPAVIAACDVLVTPISGPMHVAAAVGTPAVVIYGGYEPVSATAYEGNENLANTPECSPCWMREPCPYDRKCLRAIPVDKVEAAIAKLLGRPGLPQTHADPEEPEPVPPREQDLEEPGLGPLALPAVLRSTSPFYLAYRPDVELIYNLYPELAELSDKWVRRCVANNGGDLPRLYLLAMNLKQINEEHIPGDFAELGVGLGNSAAVLAHYARATGRTLYLFDHFASPPAELQAGGDGDHAADSSIDLVMQNIGSDGVVCVRGHFPESASPALLATPLSAVHIDVDTYGSTQSGLRILYPRLSPGGLLIVHDYANVYWPGVKQAVDEFSRESHVSFTLVPDKSGTAILRKPW